MKTYVEKEKEKLLATKIKTDRNVRWQWRMIADGKCRNCGRVRHNKKTYCEICLEKKRQYNNLVYARRKQQETT